MRGRKPLSCRCRLSMNSPTHATEPWPVPPRVPALEDGVAHVWRVALDVSEDEVRDALALLAPDECTRADRFKFDWLRRRYVVGRAALRRILGRYLDANPRDLVFSYGPQGKPALAQPAAALAFNVSDSKDIELIAVARCPALGIDIEHLAPTRACRDIARRFFAEAEAAALEDLAPEQYVEGFYRCWTRKEAFIKGLGGGLSIPLDSFEVSVDDEARLLRVRDPQVNAQRWTLTSLEPAPGFCGCIAALDAPQVRRWRWGATSPTPFPITNIS
jgi:4'-phosphopantetheinyl transferase